MSIPRTTDVSRHLVRRPRSTSTLHPEVIRQKEAARTDLQVLSQDLETAVGSARNTDLPETIQ